MIVFFVIASDCEAKPKQERSNLKIEIASSAEM